MSEAAFSETVTSADGTVSTGTCSEAHAWSLLQRAVRHGYSVEATRTGGAVIVREIPSGSLTWTPRRKHTVTLEPSAAAGKITDQMRRDLDAIAARRSGAWLAAGRINAGFYTVPKAAAARLVQRGLVTVDGTAVSLSLAARLAMLAQDHRTTTSEPPGYRRPIDMAFRDALRTGGPVQWDGNVGLNKGGGRGGKAYYRDSTASCTCRWSYPPEDRDDARRRAHLHRQEITAAMVRTLASEEALENLRKRLAAS